MIFFDRSIPRPVADAFKQERKDVVWLSKGTPDTQWLRKAGAKGWLVISRDKRIRIRPGEKSEILDNNVGCFILASKKNMAKEEMIDLIRATLPTMERLFSVTPRPFIFTIDSRGQFRQYV